MKKITVINAYGDKNIGDAAILKIALEFIDEAYKKDCQISVMCEDTNSFSSFITDAKNVTPYQLPYGYAIRGKAKVSTIKKVIRFMNIYTNSFNLIAIDKIFKSKLPERDFYSYIKEIKSADIVVSMGGGYLTTNTTNDYFGLLLTLLPIYVAKLYKKKIIFLPMSFGPFANKYHEALSYHGVKNTTVLARDNITLNSLKALDASKKVSLFYAPDLALFLKNFKSAPKKEHNYIVLTAREWFKNEEKQKAYEDSLVKLIEYAWSKYKLKTVFIPMARNKIEDDDNRVVNRIAKELKTRNVLTIFHPKSILDVQKKIGNAYIAVCTRMHSAILATTVRTPFIAIGYGHKTLGFVKNFNIEKWHIDISNVNYNSLSQMLNDLVKKKNYDNFIERINLQQEKNFTHRDKIINLINPHQLGK